MWQSDLPSSLGNILLKSRRANLYSVEVMRCMPRLEFDLIGRIFNDAGNGPKRKLD